MRCRRGHRLLLLLRGLLLGLRLRFGLPSGFLVGFGFRVQRLGEVPARLVELGCHVVPHVDGGFRIELAGLADQLVQRGLRGAGRIIRWFRVRRRFHGLVQRVPAFPPRVHQRLGFDEPVDLAGQCAGSFRGLVGLGGEPFGLADGQAGAFGPDEFAVRCDEVTQRVHVLIVHAGLVCIADRGFRLAVACGQLAHGRLHALIGVFLLDGRRVGARQGEDDEQHDGGARNDQTAFDPGHGLRVAGGRVRVGHVLQHLFRKDGRFGFGFRSDHGGFGRTPIRRFRVGRVDHGGRSLRPGRWDGLIRLGHVGHDEHGLFRLVSGFGRRWRGSGLFRLVLGWNVLPAAAFAWLAFLPGGLVVLLRVFLQGVDPCEVVTQRVRRRQLVEQAGLFAAHRPSFPRSNTSSSWSSIRSQWSNTLAGSPSTSRFNRSVRSSCMSMEHGW